MLPPLSRYPSDYRTVFACSAIPYPALESQTLSLNGRANFQVGGGRSSATQGVGAAGPGICRALETTGCFLLTCRNLIAIMIVELSI